MCRPLQDGQVPRPLQENATTNPVWHGETTDHKLPDATDGVGRAGVEDRPE